MQIKLTSVMVDDQEKALRFYTNVLRFVKSATFEDTCGNLIQMVQE